MSIKEMYIVGAGSYGEVMFELAEELGYKISGFYDEDSEKINVDILGVKVLGKFSNLSNTEIKEKNFIVAIGNNSIRVNIMEKINEAGGYTPKLIHPLAYISASAIIGDGVYIHANSHIWTKVIVGNYSIISPNVVIAHHTEIGEGCLISTMSSIGASIKLGQKVFVGMGSTIMTGISHIVDNIIIGAGSLIIRNIDTVGVYTGTPAKKIK